MSQEKLKWEIIPAEIKNDMLYQMIIDILQKRQINTILEIGASSGDGSTEAFMVGKQGTNAKLFSIEVCTERFNVLKDRYKWDPNFYSYNVSSVNLNSFPTKREIAHFMKYNPISTLASWDLSLVMGWYDKDKEYIEKNNIPQNGIAQIKKEQNIDFFDMVLIDGSEFLGKPELDEVYGAKYIILDDIMSYKNWANHKRLCNDPSYVLLIQNNLLRNGFSIFMNFTKV